MESSATIILVALMHMMTPVSSQNLPHSSHQTTVLEQFMPPEHTCIINWVLEPGRNCEWCEAMFSPLVQGLTQGYHPSSIHIDATAGSGNKYWDFDLKGTCSVNWFMDSKFEKILTISKSPKSKRFKIDDWFFYIRVRNYF